MIENIVNSNGFDYVDLDLPSGTIWATCNVGATKPSESGLYFQWGSIEGDKERVDEPGSSSKCKYYDSTKKVFTKYTTTNNQLYLEDDAANMLMKSSWHIPSTNQIRELFDNTIRKWTYMENVPGVAFISKKDKSKSIFIPYYDDIGELWSSETDAKCEGWASILNFIPENASISWSPRSCRLPVRGVIDDTSKEPYKCDYEQKHIWKLELDLVGILRNVPRGTKLYSPVCGECELNQIILPDSELPLIECRTFGDHSTLVHFSSDGKYCGYENGECMLFPSKNDRYWLHFHIETHKTFKPYQKVLVKEHLKDCESYVWVTAEYSHYDEDTKRHYCSGACSFADDEILPYSGNEGMVGKKIVI